MNYANSQWPTAHKLCWMNTTIDCMKAKPAAKQGRKATGLK